MNISTIQQIFKPYSEGMAVTLVTGRPIYDLDISKNNSITTLVSGIYDYACQHYHMAMVRYSLAQGVNINEKAHSSDDVKKNQGNP